MAKTIFVKRLGLHHFAYLRCVAEGLEVVESAKRYLGIEHGHEAKPAHDQTVDAVRAIARRKGESAWRLIGLTIRIASVSTDRPTFDEFCEARGLDGWSEAEIAEMYAAAYPSDPKVERRSKLRERQLDLIQRIAEAEAEQAQPSDLVSGWFDDATASRLIAAGIINLAELHERIHVGGRWFSAMPGVGQTKARRIAAHLDTLLPNQPKPLKRVFSLKKELSDRSTSAQDDSSNTNGTPTTYGGFTGDLSIAAEKISDKHSVTTHLASFEARTAGSQSMIKAQSDAEAIEAWITARAKKRVSKSPPNTEFSYSDSETDSNTTKSLKDKESATVKSYRREAQRLLLWLQHERAGTTFAQMTMEDCDAYIDFLGDIPAHWISKTKAAPMEPGWAPFRGQLTVASRNQAITIISGLFAWLNSARYIHGNPWDLVSKDLGDDPNVNLLETKAIAEASAAELLSFVLAQPPSPSRDRFVFVFNFLKSVGLRSTEFIEAKLSDFSRQPEGLFMQVNGKGSKSRVALIPPVALDALQNYLVARGFGGLDTAPPEAPLVASTLDPLESVSYRALYAHIRRWITKAVSASNLPLSERTRLSRASTHWLRHTFATDAVAMGVPTDVLMAQMGHTSAKMIETRYGRAPLQRRANALGNAFSAK